MTATSHWRGHEMYCINEVWFYTDTKKKVSDFPDRPCGKCNNRNTLVDHDPCLGTLPGVMNACCGHGHGIPYVQLMDKTIIRGNDANVIIEILKRVIN